MAKKTVRVSGKDLAATLGSIAQGIGRMVDGMAIAQGETRQALRFCLPEIYRGMTPPRRRPVWTLEQRRGRGAKARPARVRNSPDLQGDAPGQARGRQVVPPAMAAETPGGELRFRTDENRRVVVADLEILRLFYQKHLDPPSFLEAGPRRELAFRPDASVWGPQHRRGLNVVMLTAGGVAPGLNTVMHEIVKGHKRYDATGGAYLRIYGVPGGFEGLLTKDHWVDLDKHEGDLFAWTHRGGSALGVGRDKQMIKSKRKREAVVDELTRRQIDILYVIGGDGSMRGAHALAKIMRDRAQQGDPCTSVVGIPKTMDNDILWCWETFGFETAVNEAARIITALHQDVRACGRIGVVQLFGAEAGYVAMFAHLASGESDAFLIPEHFHGKTGKKLRQAIQARIDRVVARVVGYSGSRKLIRPGQDPWQYAAPPHALIVVAEGVQPSRDGRDKALEEIAGMVDGSRRRYDVEIDSVVTNQPRHLIRAIDPVPLDKILCRRLAKLAVDCAMAGFHDFMVSQLLTEYVMVPLQLVVDLPVRKRVTISGGAHQMATGTSP